MTIPIENIQGLSAADKNALRSKHIPTTEDLWIALADNPQFITSLGLVADADKKRVLQALAPVATEQSQALTKNWFSMHVADLIVGIAILSSVAFVLGVDQIRCVIHQAELFVIGPRYVVAAPNGLPPFHIISKEDVALSDGSKPTTLEVLTGRYTREGMPYGAVIDPVKLSSGERLSSFDGFKIFDVKLQPTVMFAGVQLPAKVNVLMAPRAKDQPVTFEAYVLNVDSQKDGVSAVLAARQDDFRKIEPGLTQNALFAVGPFIEQPLTQSQ